ncbi:MAG: hypothetical protein KA792_10895 [Bacteroidales bacterium]|nr:hypothetical protein [Bacteroidales bacterium]
MKPTFFITFLLFLNSFSNAQFANYEFKYYEGLINSDTLFIFGDSVLIYEKPYDLILNYNKPYDSSKIVQYASWLKPFKCYKYFFGRNYTNLSNNNEFIKAGWVCIKTEKYDSVWVKFKDVTYKIDIDSSGSYKAIHQHSKITDGISYTATALVKKKMVFPLIYDRGKWVNNKYFLFCTDYNSENKDIHVLYYIYLFDKNTEKLKFIAPGMCPHFNSERKQIIFFVENWGPNPTLKLCKYDMKNQIIKTLFSMKKDSSSFCLYSDDYADCSEIKVLKYKNKYYYSFKIYKGDFDMPIPYKEISVKVDEYGNLISEKTVIKNN